MAVDNFLLGYFVAVAGHFFFAVLGWQDSGKIFCHLFKL
jgi:hypothetical protein